GLLALAGALTYAELTTMMPRAGGEYVFMREAYGRRWGFLFGWTQFFIARTGSQAALAVGFAIFLNILTGGALSGTYFTLRPFGFAIPFGHLQLVALATIAITTLINCGAVSLSGKVSTVLTFVKIALVLAVGVGAFLFATGDWGHFAQSNAGGACEGVSAAARGGMAGFGAAMLGALWAYDGWNNVAPLAGEVRDPQKNLPRAFVLGMLVVGALYIFVNLAYYYVLTPTEIANVPAASSVATQVASRFMGATAITLIAAALMTSSFGALHTSVLAGGRYPYAMSRDRLFFQSLARLNPRTHVPVRALAAQGVWACVLALSGSYDALTDYAIFALWIFYGLTTASVFIFRRTMPDAERPFRTPGYPVIPIIFLLVTAWLLFTTLLPDPRLALSELRTLSHFRLPEDGFQGINLKQFVGLGLIALGLPVYWYWSRHNLAAAAPAPESD
ncbi:MAG: amino acid permease, partial [Acidobacteria bacterium]|nr:amino acid permease [Acidobacteriota bacterium]